MRTEITSTREPQESHMGRVTYHHKSLPGENPYFNLGRVRGGDTFFYNNLISSSPIGDIATFGPGGFGNSREFIKSVVR